ncbi:helix-turn-helix domain-containing protein [Maritalea mediterranea]|uniref:Helix-turn-helix domain-containing protein n=1 Tax=Maritalea mediterranea TaxID=2909667 RepID=A0ABS9E8C0_9HYPH|nr:helix-turn-helix domain-containing protein [Maritalea mediterranea]MCF4099130.1 helix-turn-helix domain-containing protein [Maritalea mediterranea]
MEKSDPQLGPARGLIAKRLSMAEFDLTRIAPSAAAGRWVENYWVIEWDRGDKPVFQQENLPHPSAHLVLDPQAGSGLFGVQTKRFFYDLSGKGRVIGAKFRPGYLLPLWGQAVSTLTDTSETDLTPLDIDLVALETSFVALDPPSEMAEILDQHLAALEAPADQKAELANQLVHMVEADSELTRVSELAAQSGLNARQLQRLFAHYIGVSPKWVIDRYRMIEAVEAINQGEERSLTELAHRLGYFDQAHFTKTFSALIGRTPQQLLAQLA